ncbi:MAG: hypothetical protein ACK2UJ_11570 [Candidatus Promineifilaceae bacterium]|jgi:hypothetical protein
MFYHQASDDFEKQYRRAFWRKLRALLQGGSNELLEYDAVRRELPFQGQRDLGMRTIPLDKIVGSVGRYRDFDRAFLPTQRETRGRWINISKARYEDVELPAIEVYKLGDVYFVRDGNHRVSVARERNQDFIDAYVTEIDVPILITPDMDLQAVIEKKDYAQFMQHTNLNRMRPDSDLELSLKDEFGRLLLQIDAHRYYLSMERGYEVSYEEAAVSWYDNVYLPLVAVIKDHGLTDELPDYTLTDLYLFVSEYQWLLREEEDEESLENEIEIMSELYRDAGAQKVINYLRRRHWISQMIIDQELEAFQSQTNLAQMRPEIDVRLSFPGKYRNLLRHINAHQYFMSLERHAQIPYEEAVNSFFDTIFLPLRELVHEEDLMEDFPRRTEDDLVLWVLDHRSDLVEALDSLPRPGE